MSRESEDYQYLKEKIDALEMEVLSLEQQNRALQQNQVAFELNEVKMLDIQRLASIYSWEVNVISRHLKCSDPLLEILNQDTDESLVIEDLFKIIHPEDVDSFQNIYHNSMSEKAPFEFIHRLILPGGEEKIVNHYCKTFFLDNGMPLKSMGLIQDITEVKQIETELKDAITEAKAAQEKYIQTEWQTQATSAKRATHLYQRQGSPALKPLITNQVNNLAASPQNQQAIIRFNLDPAKQEEEATQRSAIAIPIQLFNQTIGTIQIHEIEHPRHWTARELALVQAIAEQVAQTAENLRLFDETRQRVSQEQTIREITDKMRAAPNLDRLMEITATELGQHLLATHAKLKLGIAPKRSTGNGNGSK